MSNSETFPASTHSPCYYELPDYFYPLRLDQTPTTPTWKLPVMYREGNNGVLYLWQIGFDGTQLVRLHGPTTTTTINTREVELNSSGRGLPEQALLVARNKFKSKFQAGYQIAGATDPPHVKGMKGQRYTPGCVKRWPVLGSPKLEGARLLTQHVGGRRVVCRSYLNTIYTHLIYIESEVLDFMPYLPAFTTLDGEMYHHGMSFQRIISAIKTMNSVHPDMKQIQYHIFDMVCEDNPPSEERYAILQGAYNKWQEDRQHLRQQRDPKLPPLEELDIISIVPQTPLYDDTQVIALKDFYVSHGYEGLYLRPMANGELPGSKAYEESRYYYGRSSRVFKVKDFIDEEGIVVGVEEGKGKDRGTAKLLVQDPSGNIVTVRFGSQEDRTSWLAHPEMVVGQPFTFKYAERSSYGKAQHATGVGFRTYE